MVLFYGYYLSVGITEFFEIQDGSKLLPALNIYTGFSRQKILHRNGLKKSREVRMIELLNIIFIFPAIGKINYLLS
jgi:hypothetical protein